MKGFDYGAKSNCWFCGMNGSSATFSKMGSFFSFYLRLLDLEILTEEELRIKNFFFFPCRK